MRLSKIYIAHTFFVDKIITFITLSPNYKALNSNAKFVIFTSAGINQQSHTNIRYCYKKIGYFETSAQDCGQMEISLTCNNMVIKLFIT